MNKVGTVNPEIRDVWIRKALGAIQPGLRILDAGAGQQPYKSDCRHLRYVSQDFGQYDPKSLDVGLQQPRWDYGKLDITCDITSIPEPDESFDAILCSEVFEHIPDPVAALRELTRILKPKGTLLLTAPFCSITHFAPFHFSTGFSRFFYEHHLGSLGFDIVEISPNGNFFEYVAQEVNRIETVRQMYCKTAPRMRRWDRLAIKWLFRFLQQYSEDDRQSSELLCFGYHVHAVKR